MTSDRKSRAIELRMSGRSIKSIAKELSTAQSSISIWTRGVALSLDQIKALRANTHSPETIEKRRLSRLKSETEKRERVVNEARSEISSINEHELWLIGISLYWAEGGKREGMVRFSNGDPRMITLIMRFFREVCRVDEAKMRGYIHIHPHLDPIAAELYWQNITKIPKEKFYKTYTKPNKSSKNTGKDSLPYGVCDVYVLDANLLLKIRGWTNGIYESVA